MPPTGGGVNILFLQAPCIVVRHVWARLLCQVALATSVRALTESSQRFPPPKDRCSWLSSVWLALKSMLQLASHDTLCMNVPVYTYVHIYMHFGGIENRWELLSPGFWWGGKCMALGILCLVFKGGRGFRSCSLLLRFTFRLNNVYNP